MQTSIDDCPASSIIEALIMHFAFFGYCKLTDHLLSLVFTSLILYRRYKLQPYEGEKGKKDFSFEFISALQSERISFDRPSFAFDFSFLIRLSRIEFVVVVRFAVYSVSWLLSRHGAFEFGTCN